MTRLYAPDFCKAPDMAYLIGMTPTKFKEAVRNGFLPQPVKNPFSGEEVWDREEVVAIMRAERKASQQPDSDILTRAAGAA